MSTLRFTRLQLRNWKNFKSVDVPLAQRVFVIGPNAVGKSNFLLALRFLRDLASEDGSLVKAVAVNHGLAAVRSLHAKQYTAVEIRATIKDELGSGWRYELGFDGHETNRERPVITFERVFELHADGSEVAKLNRPDPTTDRMGDRLDAESLSQTALQQAQANRSFRGLVEFLRGVSYLHIVPQLLREPPSSPTKGVSLEMDPYGRDLLDRIRQKNVREQRSRLRRIENVLKNVVPQLQKLSLRTDEHGKPHLECRFKHWRGVAALQNETQFSDGTLRFIGLLWAIQEPAGPLLLEEPELSLHTAIVRRLAPYIQRAQASAGGRQVILSTHSEHLLAHPGIASEEIVLVQPANEGSSAICGADQPRIKKLMQSGVLASEAAVPATVPVQTEMLLSNLP